MITNIDQKEAQKRNAMNKNRGQLAQQIVTNPIYKEAFGMIKAKFIDDLTKTTFKQSSERDELWRKMQTIEAVEAYIVDVLETGKIAEESLNAFQKALKLTGL